MKIQSMSNLAQRLIVGSLSTFVMFSAIYFSHEGYLRHLFAFLITAAIGTALWEFYAIARAVNYQPLRKCALFFSTFYLLVLYLNAQMDVSFSSLPQLALILTLISSFGYFFIKGKNPLANIGITLLGLVYLTFPLGFLISIDYLFPQDSIHDGRIWLIYLLLVTKMMDIGAYITGKTLGKRKITPFISPSKTFEGTVGGLLASVLTSILFSFILEKFYAISLLSVPASILLSIAIGLVAQFGDLAESLLKREGNIKDSNQLPGLGGVLDVVDSLVFTAPLLYFFLQYRLLFL